MPGEKFKVFTEIPTNEKCIVNMVTTEQLTFDIACELLNKLDKENKEYKILVKSLKDQNQKLKLKLKDLGVEYY